MSKSHVAIVGAGIVGLATAYAAARRGHRVTVFDRTERAVGASIRNFGMVWPIGQPAGSLLNRALFSREQWVKLAAEAGIFADPVGSLHAAYHDDEWQILQEFVAANIDAGYTIQLLTPAEATAKSPTLNASGLRGALWSATEVIVDPRQAIRALPGLLAEQYGVTFRFGTAVSAVDYPYLTAGDERIEADQIYVASGPDFETLYPALFAKSGMTKCKLQMMRTAPQPGGWRIGPALCFGLTLTHYAAFKDCPTLPTLQARIDATLADYPALGIHVMACQNGLGELVIGDSHQYGLTPEPFDSAHIDQLVLDYLHTYSTFPAPAIAERWHGIYPKLNGKTEFVATPEPGVTILNGLGGAGMTLSFGLADEVVSGTYSLTSLTNKTPLLA